MRVPFSAMRWQPSSTGPEGAQALAASLLMVLTSASFVFGATITVDTLVDEDLANSSCSLREAIAAANDDTPYNGCPAGDGHDLIRFSVAGTIELGGDLPFISDGLEVAGPGADSLVIDGQDLHGMFDFEDLDGTAPFAFSGLTLTRGAANSGPALNAGTGQTLVVRDMVLSGNTASSSGGAISLFGSIGLPSSLTMERVALIDNEAQGPSSGGAVRVGNNEVTVEIRDSLFHGNRATHENGNGGGLLALGTTADVTITIHNTTFSGNRSNDGGGGVKLIGLANATITDSTFTDNTANFDADGTEGGGGVSTDAGMITMTNTVVAGNSVGGASTWTDLENTAYSSNGFNFIGDNTGVAGPFPAGNPNINGDYVGTGAAPLDPLLQPIADNGGATLSHMPDLASSPLLDNGSCTGSPADQRGYGNPVTGMRIFDAQGFGDADDSCDVGAVEAFTEAVAGPLVFADGFESGDVAAWSGTTP